MKACRGVIIITLTNLPIPRPYTLCHRRWKSVWCVFYVEQSSFSIHGTLGRVRCASPQIFCKLLQCCRFSADAPNPSAMRRSSSELVCSASFSAIGASMSCSSRCVMAVYSSEQALNQTQVLSDRQEIDLDSSSKLVAYDSQTYDQLGIDHDGSGERFTCQHLRQRQRVVRRRSIYQHYGRWIGASQEVLVGWQKKRVISS